MDINKKIAENLCKSGFEQFRNGTNYLSICEQLELNEEIHDDAGIFICKEDKKLWEDDVEQFLNFEIEPGVTLKDVIEFYYRYNKHEITEEELLENLSNHDHEKCYILISEEEFYKGTTILGESKLINYAAEAMKNFNEAMEISKRIWDIIDDCIKKAKENATTAR